MRSFPDPCESIRNRRRRFGAKFALISPEYAIAKYIPDGNHTSVLGALAEHGRILTSIFWFLSGFQSSIVDIETTVDLPSQLGLNLMYCCFPGSAQNDPKKACPQYGLGQKNIDNIPLAPKNPWKLRLNKLKRLLYE
ncbi:hypothetical protein M2360_002278 [Rhizobium sp. SG_E_25_P2]|uniref:hypothetical protein n=1 Tax=Rhizobium sp. SG_E_25_P2 TaxID=2879942 RepID=UPI002475DAFC|nr:hypothetical protein [Rhizobium sp. SG_E_25_P2]MDH6266882.1 hypothetical protein [Rhizobium sp. SG_E_25_P2]